MRGRRRGNHNPKYVTNITHYEGTAMNLVVERFGWWVRLYIGSTANRRRLWRWSFDGIAGRHHGITLRLWGERCVGLQRRRLT
jgi:hypothetical protein